jgi:hypothetical protein
VLAGSYEEIVAADRAKPAAPGEILKGRLHGNGCVWEGAAVSNGQQQVTCAAGCMRIHKMMVMGGTSMRLVPRMVEPAVGDPPG